MSLKEAVGSLWDAFKWRDQPEDDYQYNSVPDPHENLKPPRRDPVGERSREMKATDTMSDPKVVNIHTTTQLKVVVIKPTDYDAAVEIAEQLRQKRTVVLNLESMKKPDAALLRSFVWGVVTALDGKFQIVARDTHIATPYNVDIMADELIDNLESNGTYFN
ncbi:cell division protein SepF [Clostridia bacterium]|nr:cell division protein SepF [Clostridia bacterium]